MKNMYQVHRRWRSRIVFIGVVGLVIAGIVIFPLLQPSGRAGVSESAVILTASSHMYRPDETPTFRLRVGPQPADSSFGMLGIARTYAATEAVTATVTYKGVATGIKPDITKQSNGDYQIKLSTYSNHAPGSYRLAATINTSNGQLVKQQDFTWGVLAINFDQSEYISGEVAHIYYGVLDSRGHTLCSAPIEATLSAPNGSTAKLTVIPSGTCNGDDYQPLPDYSSTYTTNQTGTYKVTVRLADTQYQQSDSFRVVDSAKFSIVRTGPTRIYPPSPYTMSLDVRTATTYSGTVEDSLPDSFVIIDTGGAVVTKRGERLVLTWPVNMSAGSTQMLSYRFKAPPVSPAFYFAGPLVMNSAPGSSDYTEARQWQIAGDATIAVVNTSYFPQQTASGGLATYTLSTPTTVGNALVLLYGANNSSANALLKGVTDNAGNSWVSPLPNTVGDLPPSNFNTGGGSVVSMAYTANAASVTTITVSTGATTNHGVVVIELSGVASGNAGFAGVSDSQAASSSHISPGLALQFCDQVTTEQQLRGGNYFCSNDAAIVFASSVAGAQTTYSTSTAGYTPLTSICVAATCGAGASKMGAAYALFASSTTTAVTWTGNNSNVAGLAIMALRQEKLGSYEQSLFWAN